MRGLLALLDVDGSVRPPKMGIAGYEAPGSQRASYQGRDQSPLRVTVTPDEKRAIEAQAEEAGLSVASRAVASGRGSVLAHKAVGELAKVAGDQRQLAFASQSTRCPTSFRNVTPIQDHYRLQVGCAELEIGHGLTKKPHTLDPEQSRERKAWRRAANFQARHGGQSFLRWPPLWTST